MPNQYKSLGYYNQFKKNYIFSGGNEAWSFEAFVVQEADEIAQRHHDLEDAVRGKILSTDSVLELIKPIIESGEDEERAKIRISELNDSLDDKERFICKMSRDVVDVLVSRLVNVSQYNLFKLIIDNKLERDTLTEFML